MIFSYRKVRGVTRDQLKYLLLSSVLGFIGGNAIVPLIYGINFPPVLNFLVPLHLFTMAYAVLKYRLMDIRVVVRRGIVIFTALFILISVSAPSVILVANLVDYPINYFVFWIAIAIFSGCVLVFIPLKNLLERYFNKHFFASLYNEERVLRNLIREIPKVLNIKQLTDLIVDTTQRILQIEKISLWSIDVKEREFVPLKTVNCKPGNSRELVGNLTFLRRMLKHREPLMLQEISNITDDEAYNERSRNFFLKLKDIMAERGIEIVLPLILKRELVGIMFIGRKIDKAAYSDQDMNVLKIIADQSAVALENASLYAETQKFGERMERAVKKATAKLRKINKQLTKLDKAKSEFISIASHQLRTPLTAIKGYTSMVLDGDYGRVNKNLLPALDRIYGSTKRMTALIENLLNISRIESGKIIFNFVDIKFDELIQGVVKEFYSIVKKKGLELKCDCQKDIPVIKADEVKIREVVSNLIDNAIKYTEKGSVKVSVKVADEYKNNYLLLAVKDTGMGIAEADLPNIFQKFRRGKKVSLVHTEGLGLGMYFSQKVVEAHKGKIWVDSEGEGMGSTFYVMLPVGVTK